MHLLKILSNISLFILIINVILYSVGFFKNGKAYKIFTLYLFSIAVIQVLTALYAINNRNNHFLSTYYLFFQFITLSVLFHELFKNVNHLKGKIIRYSSFAASCLLVLQYILHPGQYYTFNSIGFFITSILLIIYSVLYLYELLTKKLPFYYVTIGAFIYLISSALIFASAASLVAFNNAVSFYIWQTNAGLFILYQLFIFWEWKKQFLRQIIKPS